MTHNYERMTDYELMVQREIQTTNAYGFGSYREENKEEASRQRETLAAIDAEAKKRELIDARGMLTEKGLALGADRDSRSKSMHQQNRDYWAARLGTRRVGPVRTVYGECY